MALPADLYQLTINVYGGVESYAIPTESYRRLTHAWCLRGCTYHISIMNLIRTEGLITNNIGTIYNGVCELITDDAGVDIDIIAGILDMVTVYKFNN